jgi:hypothetical protein
MEKRLVVLRFLFPANENPPEAIHPGVQPFDDPATGATTMKTLGSLFLAW